MHQRLPSPSPPLLLLLIVVSCTRANDFSLKLLNPARYPLARCLDGSPPGYYLRPGAGDGANNIKIHLQGGGWCTSDADCLARSRTVLGSSTQWSLHPTADDLGPDKNLGVAGLLSNDTRTNPFAAWTAVFIRYCDGSSYSSFRDAPVDNKDDSSVYHRGHAILAAIMTDLAPYFAAADAVILSGTSAGGLAAYMHADWVAAQLPARVSTFAVVPDAGVFLDTRNVAGLPAFRASMKAGLEIWFGHHGRVPSNCSDASCLAANPLTPWICYFAQYLLPHLATPVFMVNSLYDSANLELVLQLGPCAANLTLCNGTELAAAQAYRDVMLATLQKVALDPPATGVFLSACNQHEETCRDPDFTGITIQSTPLATAVGAWFFHNASTKLVDSRWPENDSCWVGDHGAC